MRQCNNVSHIQCGVVGAGKKSTRRACRLLVPANRTQCVSNGFGYPLEFLQHSPTHDFNDFFFLEYQKIISTLHISIYTHGSRAGKRVSLLSLRIFFYILNFVY